MYIYPSIFLAYGGNWFDGDKVVVNGPEAEAALEWYVALLKSSAPEGVENWNWPDIADAFGQGTLGSYIDTHNSAAVLADPTKSQVVGKIGFARWPKGPSGRRVTSIWNWSFPINASVSDKEKAAAWLFIQWAGSKEVQAATSYGFDGAYKRLGVNRTSLWSSRAVHRSSSTASAPASPRPRWPRSRRTPTSTGARACRSGPAVGEIVATAVQAALVGQATPAARARRRPGAGRRDHEAVSGRPGPRASANALAAGERRFAILLVAPALLVLLLTTTFPIVFLIWNSFQTINLAMPFLDGFAGLANYRQMLGDAAFWHSLRLTAIYTGSTVVMQLAIGLGLALLVLQIPRGQWLFRIVAILPIVLAPGRRRPLLAHADVRPELRHDRLRHPRARPRHRQLARRADAGADLGHRHPHLAVDALRLPRPPREPRLAAGGPLRGGEARPRQRLQPLPPHHPAADPARRSSSSSSCAR